MERVVAWLVVCRQMITRFGRPSEPPAASSSAHTRLTSALASCVLAGAAPISRPRRDRHFGDTPTVGALAPGSWVDVIMSTGAPNQSTL